MLSKSQLVLARKEVEKTYIGKCKIIAYEKVRKSNSASKNEEVVKQDNISCKLVYLTVSPSIETNAQTVVNQIIQLHLAPEIEIEPGTKIVVTQNDVTESYELSGKPAIMLTHQEIKLVLFKGWS